MCIHMTLTHWPPYRVPTIRGPLKIIGLFCRRALQKRLYYVKETYNLYICLYVHTYDTHTLTLGADIYPYTHIRTFVHTHISVQLYIHTTHTHCPSHTLMCECHMSMCECMSMCGIHVWVWYACYVWKIHTALTSMCECHMYLICQCVTSMREYHMYLSMCECHIYLICQSVTSVCRCDKRVMACVHVTSTSYVNLWHQCVRVTCTSYVNV